MINFFFVSRLEVPEAVTGGAPVGRNTFFTEVFLEVLKPGCYAIELVLKDRELTGVNSIIASRESNEARRCFCFSKALQRRRFHAYGQAPAPAGVSVAQPTAATPDIPNDMLTPLAGIWPRDDGKLSSDLELFVEASVYLCKAGPCDGDDACGRLARRDKGVPLVTRRSDVEVVDIKGGPVFRGVDVGADAAVRAGTAAAGRLFGDAGSPTTGGDAFLAALLADRRLERLERRLRQDLRPAPVDPTLDVGSAALSPPAERGESARGGARRGRRSTGA